MAKRTKELGLGRGLNALLGDPDLQPQFFGSFCHNKLLFQSKTSGAERNDIDS